MSERKSASAYRTISEVAESLGVPQHVLRFWETKFPAVKPLKRGGNRRYYRPEDIELLQVIHRLLHVDGYTIKGAQKLLKERGARALVEELLSGGTAPTPAERSAETLAEIDAEAEVEAALAEAGIPEALTVEPDVPVSTMASPAAEMTAAPAVASTLEPEPAPGPKPEVTPALFEAALEIEAVGGSAPVAMAIEEGRAPAAAPQRGEAAAPVEVAQAGSKPAASVQDRQAQQKLVMELKSIRARLANALGDSAPAGN